MKYFFGGIVFILLSNFTFAQVDSAWDLTMNLDSLRAEKVECDCDKVGFKIKILEFHNEGDFLWGLVGDTCYYSYNRLYMADVDLKLSLLDQLLAFEDDTSVVCMNVHSYWRMFVDSISKINTHEYSISIDALYHINFICFGVLAGYYCPFPVLYDTVTNQIINNDPVKIKEVFAYYRKWYAKCKKSNFKNYSFPLLKTRYRWKYGHTDDRPMNALPTMMDGMEKWIGRPKDHIGYRGSDSPGKKR